MSIEARLGSAIQDLEDRICEGLEVAEAIRETAEEYKLKDEVLRVRGAKLLGPLDQVKAKSHRRVAAAHDRLAFKAAVDAHTEQDADCSMRDWLVAQLGREPTEDELKIAYERSTEAWFAKHMKDLLD